MAKRSHKGRGRLSKIQQLPDAAHSAISWAAAELTEGSKTQDEIREEFNRQLIELGCEPVSRSAFNRHAVRVEATARHLRDTREIAQALTDRLGPDKADNITVLIVDMIKSASFEILQNGQMTPKGLMELARAMSTAVNAQVKSSEHRNQTIEQAREDALKAAQSAVDNMQQDNPKLNGKSILDEIRKAYGIES